MLARSTGSDRNALTNGLRLVVVCAAMAMVAAACGGGDGGTPDVAANATSDSSPNPSPDDSTITGSAADDADAEETSPDELAYFDDGSTSTTTPDGADGTDGVDDQQGQGDAAITTTTAGSGGAPVTTIGGDSGGDTSIYTGVLGTLGPDEAVTDPVVAAPAAQPGILPLTGLPGNVPNRPAAVVKIDNSSKGRPQTGLNAADIVIEEEVEGGITRLAAVFHSNPSIVGPVRSGRTTDIGIINGLGDPLFIYSGANDVTDALIRAQRDVQNRSAESSSGYWRSSSRKAPWNLYTDTDPHWASAAGGPPPPQFAYRSTDPMLDGAPTTSFTVAYRSSRADWTWDGSAWLRKQGGTPHLTASGDQVSAANVVVIEATRVGTGMVDGSGATVPEFVFVGSGPATVFSYGLRFEGTWTRPTLTSVATLTTADGSVIELTPGRTWIELIEAGSGILS
jgi:hypothetical protein